MAKVMVFTNAPIDSMVYKVRITRIVHENLDSGPYCLILFHLLLLYNHDTHSL